MPLRSGSNFRLVSETFFCIGVTVALMKWSVRNYRWEKCGGGKVMRMGEGTTYTGPSCRIENHIGLAHKKMQPLSCRSLYFNTDSGVRMVFLKINHTVHHGIGIMSLEMIPGICGVERLGHMDKLLASHVLQRIVTDDGSRSCGKTLHHITHGRVVVLRAENRGVDGDLGANQRADLVDKG